MKLFAKRCCRMVSVVCICALLLPALLGLSAAADIVSYPTKLRIGEKVVWGDFVDAKGKPAELSIADGQYTLLTYWASWCPDCQREFKELPKLKSVLNEYDNVKWYLIDCVDGQRETLKNGAAFVEKQNVGLPVLYDTSRDAIRGVDIKEIPTTIILDPQGKAVICYPTVISSKAHLRAMLDYAIKGADVDTLNYVKSSLLTADGTVKSAPESKSADSLSQSLLMQYAANTANRELMLKLNAEVTGKNLGNDLRILSAYSKNKGYEVQSVDAKNEIAKKYFLGNDSFKGKVQLGDLDLETLKMFGSEKLSKDALEIVEKGYIGESLPLYYNSYDVGTKTYTKGKIDTAQSLMTVYNLARQGKAKQQTIKWLKKEIESGRLSSGYTADGKAVKGSEESAGVYALTAMIALETGEKKLFTQSLFLMEEMRSFNAGSQYNGRFNSKSSNKAFDQCAALLLYSMM